jgi:hypothetical protein
MRLHHTSKIRRAATLLSLTFLTPENPPKTNCLMSLAGGGGYIGKAGTAGCRWGLL